MDTETLVGRIRVQLDISARARADALAGEPASGATAWGATENDIVARVRQERTRSLGEVDAGIDRVDRQRDALHQRAQQARDEFASAESQKPPVPPGHEQAARDLAQAQAHLNVFRHDNQLRRQARLPGNRFLAFSLVLAVVVVEGVVNSFFFSFASDFGLLGGFFQAFFVSGVNVGIAFLGGFFALRQLQHISPARKLLGLAGLGFALVVVAAINLMAAQYRGLLEQGAENPEYLVVQQILDMDFSGALNSLNSVLLVMIGVLCAIFAMWKGFRADDPYPGYGDMQRDVDRAASRLRELQEDAADDAEDWKEDKLGQMSAMRRSLEQLRLELKDLESLCKSMRRAEDECSPARLKDAAMQLLSEYRDENRRMRGEPAPRHFGEYPAPDEFEDPGGGERAKAHLARLSEAEEKIRREAEEVAALLHSVEAQAGLLKTSS